MAEKKASEARSPEEIAKDEAKIKEMIEKFNEQLLVEMNGKPYLLVLSTLHEISREGDESKLAAQWNWRSNINASEEGRSKKEVETSRTLMKYLSERLHDVVNNPTMGLKKKYGF